jgi:hypothetical protein
MKDMKPSGASQIVRPPISPEAATVAEAYLFLHEIARLTPTPPVSAESAKR